MNALSVEVGGYKLPFVVMAVAQILTVAPLLVLLPSKKGDLGFVN